MTCPDPEAAAWRILSLQDGLSLQVVAHGTILDRITVSDWVARIAEIELGPGRRSFLEERRKSV